MDSRCSQRPSLAGPTHRGRTGEHVALVAELAAHSATGELRQAVHVHVVGGRILSDGLDEIRIHLLDAARDRVRPGGIDPSFPFAPD
jgi:hypothetical protein